MWNLNLSRKEFVDYWLGNNRKSLLLSLKQSDGIILDKDLINLQWDTPPTVEYYFPQRIIASEDDLKHIFTALNSTPAAATPVSAYSRIFTPREYRTYRSKLQSPSLELAPFVALAMAEASLLTEGRSSWKDNSLAACTKTLSYTWAKALSFGDTNSISHDLPTRWFVTHSIVTDSGPSETLRTTVTATSGILNDYTKITEGLFPSKGYPEALAVALYKKDRKTLDDLWIELTYRHGINVTLDNLMRGTREERAAHLQHALKYSLMPENDGSATALCAFLATQVAPGSLEHLDLLRTARNPEIALWYAMYAALLSPSDILGIQGGMGYRIYKQLIAVPPMNQPSIADICFSELKVLERSGMGAFVKKTTSSRELQVELVPYVTSSFDYTSAQQFEMRNERGRLDVIEHEYNQASRLNHEYKVRVEQAILLLSGIMNDSPEDYNNAYEVRRLINRKKSIE